MSISTSMHKPAKARANNGDGIAWVTIDDESESSVSIFLPDRSGADKVSEAINEAIQNG